MAAITAAVLIMIVLAAAGPNVTVPRLPRAGRLPWWHALHLTATLVTVSLWAWSLSAAARGRACARSWRPRSWP